MSKEWFTAAELAGLPGLPGTERGIRKSGQSWKFREVPAACRGGRRFEYHLSSLPDAARLHLEEAQIQHILAVPATQLQVVKEAQLPAISEDTTQLKGWQRRAMEARLAILHHVDLMAITIGVDRAIKRMVELASTHELPEHLMQMVPLANARTGQNGSRTLSRPTIYKWISLRKQGNAALAPRAQEERGMPSWAFQALGFYRQPHKPSIAAVHEQLAKLLPDCPSIHSLRRFLTKKMSRLDVQKGRMSPGQVRNKIKMFTERSLEGFLPLDIAIVDGHTYKAKVAHPVHGKPFQPEVCGMIDAVTRVCFGWSAGLSESAETVAGAVRHGVTVNEDKKLGGIPAILYSDNGAGNMAQVNSKEVVGLFARLGITHKTGRPGNPQGRGMVERLQATLWIRSAEELPTFVGKKMDGDVARSVHLATARDIKRQGRSDLVIGWQEFLDHLARSVDAYNRRPHRSLPKITDPTTGLRRHMCPYEMWARFLVEGWQPVVPDAAEIEDLYRPRITVKVRRGFVRLLGSTYGDRALEHYNEMELPVAYDINDASKVWVYDEEERLICKAKFEPTKRSYFPVPEVDQSRARRAKRRLKLVDLKREEIELEALGPAYLAEESEEVAEARQALIIDMATARREPDPAEMNEAERYEYWKTINGRAERGEELGEELMSFHQAFRRSATYRAFAEMEQDLQAK